MVIELPCVATEVFHLELYVRYADYGRRLVQFLGFVESFDTEFYDEL